MRFTYTPDGTSGFRCEMTDDVGLTVAVSQTDAGTTATVDPEGLPDKAVTGALLLYAQHEHARLRSRSTETREHHEREAKRWRKAADQVGELLGDLTTTTESGWCSDCLTLSDHRLVSTRSRLRVKRYVCAACGSPTGRCDVPKCPHFADRGGAPSERSRFCAEHSHQIPSFESLESPVASLEEFTSWLEFERFNAKRVSTVATVSVAGVAVLAPMAFAAAPAIGGAIGAWGGLSGAAATGHGLAILGGGSLAAGGLGIAGGTAVVTAVGSGLGGVAGAALATSYVRSDRSFGFELVNSGDSTTVIFANGFMSEGQEGWGDWRRIITERYPDATVYRLRWGAKELENLAELLPAGAAAPAAKAAIGLAAKATAKAAARLGPVAAAFAAADLAKNPWHVARTRATMTGSVLAEAIVRAELTDVVLVGFSLGGRVMASATEALATRREERPRVQEVHLLGAAVGAHREWRALEPAVEGKIYNYFSSNDRVLGKLYKAAEAGTKAVGHSGIPTKSIKIKNVNVSEQVASHNDHLRAVSLR